MGIALLEVVGIGSLRLDNVAQAPFGKRVHDSAVDEVIATDLTAHPDHEARVHADVVVLGAARLVGNLNLGGSATDVGGGKRDDVAAANDGGRR